MKLFCGLTSMSNTQRSWWPSRLSMNGSPLIIIDHLRKYCFMLAAIPSGYPVQDYLTWLQRRRISGAPNRRASCTLRSSPRQHSSPRSEEHTSELQSRENLVCRLLLEKKKKHHQTTSL